MYSSGLPILYPLGMVFYIILYWVYKGLILKYYQKTTSFNERLAIDSISYIKYGLVVHMLVGGFMYTNSRILSSSNELKLQQISDYVNLIKNRYFNDRFSTAYSQLYAAVFIVIIIIYLFKSVIINFFGSIVYRILCCTCCMKRRKSITETKSVVESEDIYSDLSLINLAEFYKRVAGDLNYYKDMLATNNYDKTKFDSNTSNRFRTMQ